VFNSCGAEVLSLLLDDPNEDISAVEVIVKDLQSDFGVRMCIDRLTCYNIYTWHMQRRV